MSDDLVKRLRDLGDHAAFEPHMHHEAADRIEELEENINLKADFIDATLNQLAASEQRIEELEAKLTDQAHLIKQFFALLNVTEESDEGRTFRPNVITSCRVADAEKLEQILSKLKGFIND